LEKPTKEQNDAFFKYIEDSKDFGWWHWFGNTWLLTTFNQNHTVETVQKTVLGYFTPGNHLVLELRPDGTDTWGGFGPAGEKEGEKNMFTWIKTNWKKVK